MAVDSTTAGFGKRAIHRVWGDELRGGEFLWLSQRRGWSAVALLAAGAIACLRAAILVGGRGAPALVPDVTGASVIIALLLGGAGAAFLWAALHVLRSLLKPGPLLRLDPTRIVLRAPSGHIVLAWEEVTLTFGRVFMRIVVRSSRAHSADRAHPDEILVPILLLCGGASGVCDAIRRVRSDILDETSG